MLRMEADGSARAKSVPHGEVTADVSGGLPGAGIVSKQAIIRPESRLLPAKGGYSHCRSPFSSVLYRKLKDSREFDLLVEKGEPDANPRPGGSARNCGIPVDQSGSCLGTTSHRCSATSFER